MRELGKLKLHYNDFRLFKWKELIDKSPVGKSVIWK
jgi:hypothetical protein